MGIQILTNEIAREKSTFVITAVFTDENGDAVTPDSMTWSLMDSDGEPINSRTDVNIISLDTSVDVVLSGDDLQILSGETGEVVVRKILFEGTYTSDAGSDLPLRDAAIFSLYNLTGVS